MKKFFAFAMLFAAVAMVACGGEKKDKENKDGQCSGNCEQCETPCDKACTEGTCAEGQCDKACAEGTCAEGQCDKAAL